MIFKVTLRYHIALTFLVAGWLVSTIMGGILYWLTINMEKDFIEETLSSELDDYMNRYNNNANAIPPSGLHIHTYVVTKQTLDNELPIPLQNIKLGLSHITMNKAGYFVESRASQQTRFLMLYADEQIEMRKNQYLELLILGVILMTVLSGIIGLWLASQVIAPLTGLARLVSKMGADFKPLPLTEDLPHDEIGELTRTIDGYYQRLAAFNERERAFTSDVSHELRTPIAVIKGASEVILTQPDLASDNRKRVERIARAATQITHLTTALLALAREESDNDKHHQHPVEQVLIQVVEEHKYLLNHKPVSVKLDTSSNLSTTANPVLLYVVLANIVRNAFSYTHRGVVFISIQGQQIIINDTGTGIQANQLMKMFGHKYSSNPSKDGHGIGLSLVWRICNRYGWEISVQSQEGEATSMVLLLDDGKTSQQTM
jgi:signal transduction histidine kinase